MDKVKGDKTGKNRKGKFDLYGPHFEFDDLIKRLSAINDNKEKFRPFYLGRTKDKFPFHKTEYISRSPKRNITVKMKSKASANVIKAFNIEDECPRKHRRRSTLPPKPFELKLIKSQEKRKPRNVSLANTKNMMNSLS